MNNNNPMPQEGESKKKTHNLIIGILGIIVLILLFSWLDGPKETTDTPDVDSEQVGNEVDEEVENSELSTVNFTGIIPAEWDLAQRAESGIATLTSGQEIEFFVVNDPTDDTIVYFATSAYDEGDDQQMIGIYRYHTDNYAFERVFRRSYDKGDIEDINEADFPDFHVVGYEDGNLILLVMGTDDSSGPCSQPLLLSDDGGRALWSMSIEDPYGGFQEYKLTKDMRTEAEATQESCLAEFNE